MGELQKKKAPALKSKTKLPSLILKDAGFSSVLLGFQGGAAGKEIPNASIIYSIGAGCLFAFFLYFLFTGAWFTALLLLFPAFVLSGFALYYLRHAP